MGFFTSLNPTGRMGMMVRDAGAETEQFQGYSSIHAAKIVHVYALKSLAVSRGLERWQACKLLRSWGYGGIWWGG